jgi:hypothetical protein
VQQGEEGSMRPVLVHMEQWAGAEVVK